MQSFNFYFHSPQYCSTRALSGITTVNHTVFKLGRESDMEKKVKMKMFKGTQLLWKLIKNRQWNVRRGRRYQWISGRKEEVDFSSDSPDSPFCSFPSDSYIPHQGSCPGFWSLLLPISSPLTSSPTHGHTEMQAGKICS